MIVTCTDIEAKINDLPEHYAEHVHMSKPGTAFVDSFTDPLCDAYHTSIKRTEKEGERDVRCSCPATTLCVHITAFYAVAKGLKPKASEKEPKKDKGKKDKAKEGVPERTREIYKRIATAFEELAEMT